MKYIGVNELNIPVGEDHPRARLTNHDVDLICELHDEGIGYGEIAKKFNISKGSVRDFVTGRRRSQYPVRLKRVAQ